MLGAIVCTSLVASEPARADSEARAHWCAPELRVVASGVCFHQPKGEERRRSDGGRTLVIFLHSLIGASDGAAWEQQRRLRGAAETHGFTTLIPRGRPGLGPGRDPTVLGWPTALELQERHEEELLEEWRVARAEAERIAGPFERVLLFGFSNGAYYAESLAFRERLPIDGVAIFAGGSGSKYQRLLATRAKRRIPMFLGYGTLDPDRFRQEALHQMLRQIDWPHRALSAAIGHTVSDRQLDAALAFLGHEGPEPDPPSVERSKTPSTRRKR
jgi:predicted esterase